MVTVQHAIYGNRDGSHQLLETSLTGTESILEEVRFLVDRPTGHIGSEVVWEPYWGCGQVNNWWALWCGKEDCQASRKNMVRSHVLLVKKKEVMNIEDISFLFDRLEFKSSDKTWPTIDIIIDHLAENIRPVIIPDIFQAPQLLINLWPNLWPSIRVNLSLRTFFGSEALGKGVDPDIILTPNELKPRWRSYTIIDSKTERPDTATANYFIKKNTAEFERIIHENRDTLPGNFLVLKRIERIASFFENFRNNQSQFSDALMAVRTIESFDENFTLQSNDLQFLANELLAMRNPTISDIRGASLLTFSIVKDTLIDISLQTSQWVKNRLHKEQDKDVLWILEQQAKDKHVIWWLKAIRNGISQAFNDIDSNWASAIWRWWLLNVEAVEWTHNLLSTDSDTEAILLDRLPLYLDSELQNRLINLCVQRQWVKLLAGILQISNTLSDGVNVLRKKVSKPELGLEVLIRNRSDVEIITSAAESRWEPLIQSAVDLTTCHKELILKIDIYTEGAILLIAKHIQASGKLPSALYNDDFFHYLFENCIQGNLNCTNVIVYFGDKASDAIFRYPKQEALWEAINPTIREPLVLATANSWLDAFISGEKLSQPNLILRKMIQKKALSALRGGEIIKTIEFLSIFPEVSEKEVVDWLNVEGFVWSEGDDKKFGNFLLARDWKYAASQFRWSWKTELKAVAWYAKALLGYWETFLFAPQLGAYVQDVTQNNMIIEKEIKMIKILFLASNPLVSSRLAIDEEARLIEEKVRSSKLRDAISFKTKWAVRPEDLQQILLEEEPKIVHFSGHGGGKIGISFHSEDQNEEKLVSSEALADLFKVLKDDIRVVLLNACHSQEQSIAIVKEIDFVVGMSDSIGDEAARVFAAAFYRGLAFKKSVQIAFELGLNELKLLGLKDDEDIPVLLVKDGLDASLVTVMN